MELGLFRDFFGNFSTRGERYYFHVEGSMRGEIEPTQGDIEPTPGEIEMNIGKCEKLGKTQNYVLGGGDIW